MSVVFARGGQASQQPDDLRDLRNSFVDTRERIALVVDYDDQP
jgi:hypothetical protein